MSPNKEGAVFPPRLLSIYIHIPFCEKKCGYCDFYSISESPPALIDEFISCLLLEIQEKSLLSNPEIKIASIYFGGGTPSLLSSENLFKIIEPLQISKPGIPKPECTLEANPHSVTSDKLTAWKEAGFNRLSIGFQSFNDKELALLGRIHTKTQARDCLRLLEKTRWDNFSGDLMFGIPGQNMDSFRKSMENILSYSPSHLSLYGLKAEPRTPFDQRIQDGKISLPSSEIYNAQFEFGHNFLAGNGYEHYEVSNYAKPGARSVHNSRYWQRAEYIGFGPSAHSFSNDRRSANVSDVVQYVKMIRAGKLPVEWEEYPNETEILREKILLGLRTVNGIEESLVSDKKRIVHTLCEAGFLGRKSDRLFPTLRGMEVLDEVISKLIP